MESNSEFEYTLVPLEGSIKLTTSNIEGKDYCDVEVGNTGFAMSVSNKEDKPAWFQFFMPSGRASAIPELKYTSTLLYPYAFIKFLEWYKNEDNFKDPNRVKPTICYGTATNEQLHNYLKHLFQTDGEPVFEEIPEEKSYSDELKREVELGGYPKGESFGRKIDLTKLLADQTIMDRLKKYHDYAEQRITKVPVDEFS